jgi:DNA segregation ATPase FtsK/SpoIIIE-like protein
VSAKVENYSVSPTIIKFELKLAEGVRNWNN